VTGMNKKHLSSDKLFLAINIVLVAFICFIIIYPIYYMFIVSISDGNAVLRGEVNLLPKGINLKAYKAVLTYQYVPVSYRNTLVYTTIGVLISVFMTALCAYPLSRKHFFGKNVFMGFIIFTMIFDAGMISNYMVINEYNLMNTIWSIVLPGAINVWYIIIMRTFFADIPEEIFESAYIDGANDLTILGKIVLPLSKAVISTMLLFYAVGLWNNWISPLLYLNDRDKFPMQLILRNIVIGSDAALTKSMSASSDMAIMGLNIKYAVIFITILPILAVYPFVQRYFVKGVMVGSVKG